MAKRYGVFYWNRASRYGADNVLFTYVRSYDADRKARELYLLGYNAVVREIQEAN